MKSNGFAWTLNNVNCLCSCHVLRFPTFKTFKSWKQNCCEHEFNNKSSFWGLPPHIPPPPPPLSLSSPSHIHM